MQLIAKWHPIIESIYVGIIKHKRNGLEGKLNACKLLHCYLKERTLQVEILNFIHHSCLTVIVPYSVISVSYL